MDYENINIFLSKKISNHNLFNNKLIYYTHWKNNYHFNIYERMDLLVLYLIKCEEQYYLAKPIISDSVFDCLLKELKNIETKLNFSYKFSPTNNIGKR